MVEAWRDQKTGRWLPDIERPEKRSAFQIVRAQAKAQGLIRYMGRPCMYGHSGERFVSCNGCCECLAEHHRRYRFDIAFREKEAEYQRQQHILHPERYAKADKQWRADLTNKAVKARIQRDRRARKRLAGGKHTADDVAEIFTRQDFRCVYCKKDLREAKFEVDHIIPLALGGTNDRNNIQILCPQCNRRKRSIDPIKFAQRRGLLL